MILDKLDNYDWAKAFECAGEIDSDGYNDNAADVREALPGIDVLLTPFGREDVVKI